LTYVVAEPCIKCKYTDCVGVCPVDAFREGANCLVIDPDVCIDCDLCVPECPVDAIVSEGDLPDEWAEYLEINARLAVDWPEISDQKDPLPEADEFKDVQAKRDMLDESAGGN
jgi:ferredoxin